MQKNSTQLTECAEHDATIKDGIKRLSNTVQKCDFENYFEESLWFSNYEYNRSYRGAGAIFQKLSSIDEINVVRVQDCWADHDCMEMEQVTVVLERIGDLTNHLLLLIRCQILIPASSSVVQTECQA